MDMLNIVDHKARVEKRYALKSNNFWGGFFGVFGLREISVYRRAIQLIRELNDSTALYEDMKALHEDCKKVVSGLPKVPTTSELIDACP